MAPLIASLISSGLGILGNAVLAKGKDVVEEKLGIDIESALGTPEGKIRLRELEIEHEEYLLDQALESERMYFQDTESARTLGIELSKSDSYLNQNIMPILALLTVIGSSLILWYATENDVKMAAVSFITMVLGYFFGSSKGSKDKQEALYKIHGEHK